MLGYECKISDRYSRDHNIPLYYIDKNCIDRTEIKNANILIDPYVLLQHIKMDFETEYIKTRDILMEHIKDLIR